MSPTKIVVAALALLLLSTPALAADPEPGKVVEVACEKSPSQRYCCYLPSGYDPGKAWPILYCFSPNARGDLFVDRYKGVCERRGWIVVGSMNSQNGPWEPIKEAIEAMWSDTEARFSLSKTMRYASGFSGGSRVSFEVAKMKGETIAGVIGIGAGLPNPNEMPRPTLAVSIMCGETDPNKAELDPLHEKLKKAGNPVVYENFPGGHVMPEVPLLEKAVEWMDDQAVERRVERFTTAHEEAASLAESDPVKAWLLLSDALDALPDVKSGRKDAEKLLKRLERVPEVKSEAAAKKKYDDALEWIEKNASRLEKSKSVRAQARKKLAEVQEKFPGTRAAERAGKKLAEIPGED